MPWSPIDIVQFHRKISTSTGNRNMFDIIYLAQAEQKILNATVV